MSLNGLDECNSTNRKGGKGMRKSILMAAVALVLAAFLAPAALANVVQPPSTDGWTITSKIVGDKFEITPVIDNLSEVLNCTDLVTKRFENVDLGNGALLTYLDVGLDADPQIVLNFAVTAGNADQTFDIISPLAFATVNPAQATATAYVGVTDNNGGGATVTGLIAGPKMFEASYNGGTVFADLVKSPLVAPANGSNGASETKAWTNIGSVSSMKSEFYFTLTAGDGASGTSSYKLVPEPSSILALLGGLGSLCGLAWRRRR